MLPSFINPSVYAGDVKTRFADLRTVFEEIVLAGAGENEVVGAASSQRKCEVILRFFIAQDVLQTGFEVKVSVDLRPGEELESVIANKRINVRLSLGGQETKTSITPLGDVQWTEMDNVKWADNFWYQMRDLTELVRAETVKLRNGKEGSGRRCRPEAG